MKRVILHRDPEHDGFVNDAAPTALELVVPEATGDFQWLTIHMDNGVKLDIEFPMTGNTFFNEWRFDRFEIEDVE